MQGPSTVINPLHGWNSLGVDSITIGPNGTVTQNFTPTEPGYQISLSAQYTTTISPTAGAVPFVTVIATWLDNVTGITISQESWDIYIGQNAEPFIHFAKGPVQGPQLQLTFFNQDSAFTCMVTYEVSQTTHHIARDDWRSGVTPNNPPGNIYEPMAPGANMTKNVLADFNVTTSLAELNYMLPLYAGQAFLGMELQPSGSGTYQVEIIAWNGTGNLYQSPVLVSATSLIISNTPITLPRKPCEILAFGTNSFTLNLTLTVMEYAS